MQQDPELFLTSHRLTADQFENCRVPFPFIHPTFLGTIDETIAWREAKRQDMTTMLRPWAAVTAAVDIHWMQ